MSNEPHWDYILTKNHKKEAQTVKQKDKLETHAKQVSDK